LDKNHSIAEAKTAPKKPRRSIFGVYRAPPVRA
jgi:hypothetical protein